MSQKTVSKGKKRALKKSYALDYDRNKKAAFSYWRTCMKSIVVEGLPDLCPDPMLSFQTMAHKFGLKSASTAYYHFAKLKELNLVTSEQREYRGSDKCLWWEENNGRKSIIRNPFYKEQKKDTRRNFKFIMQLPNKISLNYSVSGSC